MYKMTISHILLSPQKTGALDIYFTRLFWYNILYALHLAVSDMKSTTPKFELRYLKVLGVHALWQKLAGHTSGTRAAATFCAVV